MFEWIKDYVKDKAKNIAHNVVGQLKDATHEAATTALKTMTEASKNITESMYKSTHGLNNGADEYIKFIFEKMKFDDDKKEIKAIFVELITTALHYYGIGFWGENKDKLSFIIFVLQKIINEARYSRFSDFDTLIQSLKSSIDTAIKTAIRDLKKDKEIIKAVENGNVGEIYKAFCLGANINAISHYSTKESLLHIAIFRGDTDVVRTLVQLNADIECFIPEIGTPLSYAILKYYPNSGPRKKISLEIIDFLLKNGANPDSITYESFETLLQKVSYKGYYEVVELLLTYRACSLFSVTKSGKRAIDFAYECKHYPIVELIYKFSCRYGIHNNQFEEIKYASKIFAKSLKLQLASTDLNPCYSSFYDEHDVLFLAIKAWLKPSLRTSCIDELYKISHIFFTRNDYQNGLKCLRLILEIDKNNIAIKNDLGLYLMRAGYIEEAIDYINQVLSVDRENFTALVNAGHICFFKINDYGNGEKCLQEALRIQPDSVAANENMGWGLSKMGRYSQAITWLDKALASDVKFEFGKILFYEKGYCLIRLKKYSEGIEYLDAALKVSPDQLDAVLEKASALTELNQYEQAAKCYQRALQIDRNSEFAWSGIAKTIFKMNTPEMFFHYSLMACKKACQMQPEDEELKNIYSQIFRGWLRLKKVEIIESVMNEKCFSGLSKEMKGIWGFAIGEVFDEYSYSNEDIVYIEPCTQQLIDAIVDNLKVEVCKHKKIELTEAKALIQRRLVEALQKFAMKLPQNNIIDNNNDSKPISYSDLGVNLKYQIDQFHVCKGIIEADELKEVHVEPGFIYSDLAQIRLSER